jgi:MFS family permease
LVAALIASRIVHIFGARNQLMLGLGVAAAGLLWLSRVGAGDPYLTHLLGPEILIGLGFGLTFVPMTLSATTGVPVHEAGLASGLINTTRQIGGALGLAVMATVASSVVASHERGHHAPLAALTAGYRAAFVIAGCVMVVGVLLATLLPKLNATPEVAATEAEVLDTEPFAEDLAIVEL